MPAEGKGPQPSEEEQQVPFLSFNTQITPAEDLGSAPKPEELDKMKKVDPKLQYTWNIWEQHVLPKDKKADYSDATKQSASFSTVKEFWACWNHLPQPSELLNGKKFTREKDGNKTVVDSLMIFRKGIRPEWEDPENTKGGHFQVQLKPTLGGGTIDELWNNIVLGMIGGGIEPADMITGIRLVDKLSHRTKPVIRIEVWFNDMDENDTGRFYNLKGNFERCMRTGLDGNLRTVTWGYTETTNHSRKH
mmetsp:Transcript_18527/g.38540  ORF Transcript_18527/g.38540 Transcript_18527/m.38540 type:complete len:248 (-) Transcript_18527:121-864(-)